MKLLSLLCWIIPMFPQYNMKLEEKKLHTYCIVGAGPGGLQLAYFLQQAHRDYIVFERNNRSGSFYEKYPRHRKLISINKRFTGEFNTRFNMRHDWNSLLSNNQDLLYKHYSTEFYPSADSMTRYLNDFTVKNSLNIRYNTEVYDIRRVAEEDIFYLREKVGGNLHKCKSLILATGLGEPLMPKLKGEEHITGYEDVSTDPADFTGKTVLILGRGNAAFETADSMYAETNLIHMISRHRARLAWSTHYVGDLRAINNVLLDNYQLKSLDGLIETDVNFISIDKDKNGKLFLNFSDIYQHNCGDSVSYFDDNFALRVKYDIIIRCLGFISDMSPFHSSTTPTTTMNGKYPVMKYHYESENIPGLFFAGALGHQVDYKKSAGGFIHGFRYTARTLFKILEQKYNNVTWDHKQYHIKNLLNLLVRRMNEADGLYQMFGVLGDVIVIDRETNAFEHYEDFPIKSLHLFDTISGRMVVGKNILVFNFEYGEDFSGPGKDTFQENRAVGDPEHAHKSNFLHPVLYFYKELPPGSMDKSDKFELPKPDFIHHVVEDFLTDFTAQISHLTPLRRFIEHIIQLDLRSFDSNFCLTEVLTSNNLPLGCRDETWINL